MPTLGIETVRTGGVTFVELFVDATRPHRIRLESRLDGPVWPPRVDGQPIDGWDERGVTARVDAGTTPFGFATPARPESPVATLVDAEPLTGETAPEGVAAWLRRVERRIETAEALAAVEDLSAATSAVAAVGGLAGVEALAADLARDRRSLSRLSIAPEELSARAEAVEIPTEAFARLAQAESRRS